MLQWFRVRTNTRTGGKIMKSPGGGGKRPGAPKRPVQSPGPSKPAARPQPKSPQRPPAKAPSRPQQKPERRPERKPERTPPRKPGMSPGEKQRPSMLERLRQSRQSQPHPTTGSAVTGQESTGSSGGSQGGRRRFCCLGCAVYALVVPALIIGVLAALI